MNTVFVLSFLMTLAGFICFILWNYRDNKKRNESYQKALTEAQKQAAENPIKASTGINYKYLDQYYAQTQDHAQKGFTITVFISICGALLIFFAVLYMLFLDADNDKLTANTIVCIADAITELISAVFFALYNRTVMSMKNYHDKLVLSQNIAFALRVADSLTEKHKDAAKLEIIKELVKDVNAQMMKSDADDEPPKKDKPSGDAEKPSGSE